MDGVGDATSPAGSHACGAICRVNDRARDVHAGVVWATIHLRDGDVCDAVESVHAFALWVVGPMELAKNPSARTDFKGNVL